jgi:hypothetical protein
MADTQKLAAWAVVDDRFNTGAFAVYLSQNDAEARQQSAERDGPCHVVKLITLTDAERSALCVALRNLAANGLPIIAAVIDGLLARTKTHTQENQHYG